MGFIRKTKEFIGEKIREARPTSDAYVEEMWNDWTCKVAEIYWEYSCPNAIALVHNIKHTIYQNSQNQNGFITDLTVTKITAVQRLVEQYIRMPCI